jgi:hypothetical protein
MTEKLQDAVARAASVAVQRTEVVPTGNPDADAGEQLVWIGATPPVATGAANVTVVGLLFVAVTVMLEGQVRAKPGRWSPGFGDCPGGRVGLVGEEQPAITSRSASQRVLVRVVSTRNEL